MFSLLEETSKWRQGLLAWEEEMIEECCVLLHNIALLVDNVYRWYWQLDLVASYTVSDAYDQFLTYIDQYVHSYLPDFIWHKEAL